MVCQQIHALSVARFHILPKKELNVLYLKSAVVFMNYESMLKTSTRLSYVRKFTSTARPKSASLIAAFLAFEDNNRFSGFRSR